MELDIKISNKGDAPLFPEFADKVVEGEFDKVGILEGGTMNGNTSIYFIAQTPHGPIGLQMTLNMLNGLVAIANGADKRFKEKHTYGQN